MKSLSQLTFDSIKDRGAESTKSLLKAQSRQDMVEIGGRVSQILGFPRSTGQIYGLLYFSYRPLSIGDISSLLSISKASTSTGSRQLATWGAIRKVWVPGDRRDYYEAIEDLMQIFTGSYRTIIKPRINSSKNRLKSVEESIKSDLKNQIINAEECQFINLRLEKIKKFHAKVNSVLPFLQKFID